MKSKKPKIASTRNAPTAREPDPDWERGMVNRHLKVGWWGLLLFMAMGAALEAMHALKIGYYLDARNEVRHMMWTLSHAHGTLLSLVNIAFALTLRSLSLKTAPALSSMALIAGSILMPLGFFLGGFGHFGGDPGVGVLLAPVGAVFLLVAMFQAGRQFRIK